MALVTMVSVWDAAKAKYDTTGPHTLYVGAVLGKVSRCERIMSDVYADVTYVQYWDATKGTVGEDQICTSEFGYHNAYISHEVDATPETLAAVEAWKAAAVAAQKASEERARQARVQAELDTPRKGKVAVVRRGRKVPKGTTGEVVWYGAGKSFGYGPAPMRCGLKTADGTVVWVDAKHCDVVAQSVTEMTVAA